MKNNPYYDEFIGYTMIFFSVVAAVTYLIFLLFYDPVLGNRIAFGWIYMVWIISSVGAFILSIIQYRKKYQKRVALAALILSAGFIILFFMGIGTSEESFQPLMQRLESGLMDECRDACPAESVSFKMHVNPADQTSATCFCLDENEEIIDQKII